MRAFTVRATKPDGSVKTHHFQSHDDRTALLDASILMLAMLHPSYGIVREGTFEIINDLGVILEKLEATSIQDVIDYAG